MKKRFTLVCLFVLLYSFKGFAQHDSLVKLIGVTVVELKYKDLSAGAVYRPLDSTQKALYQQRDLSSVLAEQSFVFVKSQGPGNLATTSIRGAGSQHTAVLWNGLNLSNSMNGLVDLSLIPNGLFDRIGVQYGASSSIWGSGAVGGAIHIENDENFNSPLSLSFGIESTNYDEPFNFNGFSQNFSIGRGYKNFSWSLKVSQQKNDNQFNFAESKQNLSGRDENQYGAVSNLGLAGDFYWKFKSNRKLEIHYWVQGMDRNISPSLLEANSNANLQDLSHRFSGHYSALYNFGLLGFRTGFFSKDLLFKSDNIEGAPSESENFITELYYLLNFKNKHLINIGLNNNFNIGRHKNYADIVVAESENLVSKTQNLAAIFASYKYKSQNHKLSHSISLRQEWKDEKTLPFTFDLGSEYHFSKRWKIGLRLSKMYRVPNLNDLYWNPGGNPNLQAESGYSSEGSVLLKLLNTKHLEFSVDYSGFYRRINNWIQWTPGLVWSPENLLEVESFGNEWQLKFLYKRKKLSIGTSLNYSYVITQNIRANSNNAESLEKQLIYTPINQAYANLFLKYLDWNFNFNQQYVGYVYTASDHSQFLEPLHPSNVRLQYSKRIKNQNLSCWIGINNLFNEEYQLVSLRPMPLRNYSLGFQIQLKQLKKKVPK